MSNLPRLTDDQQRVVQEWLPGAALIADLSWGQLDTAVLHLWTATGEVIIKAGGAANHHIDREIHAHQHFSAPWVKRGRGARMHRFDATAKILWLDYLPGSLMEGTPAEDIPDFYRQAGILLAELHGIGSQVDDTYEARLTQKSLASLESDHRIAPELIEPLRAALLAYQPRPVTLVPTHGDWQPRNWLIDGEILRPIDFGRAEWRPADTDFTRLAVRQWRTDPALESAFFDGYGTDPRDRERWSALLIREAIGTAVWAYQVGDRAFEAQGQRMIVEALQNGAHR